MTKYGRSPWIDALPRSRVPSYPRQRGDLTTDVAIVGGGLTGCAAAYAFAAAGVSVVLVEAGSIGRGASAGSTGWIADDPGASFVHAEKLLGRRAARHAWQSWRRAALDFSALIRRLKLGCEWEPSGSVLVASGPARVSWLDRERKARRAAGLEAALASPRAIAADVAIAAEAGVRSREGATIDPYRASIGLAAAAAVRGARLFENSAARRTTFTRRTATVVTGDGSILAKKVIVATGLPTALFGSLRRHFWFKSAFSALTAPLPAKIRRVLGAGGLVVRDAAVPPHVVRWVDGERLLVTGADGATVPDRLREKVIVQRTGQLMYELSTLYPDISGIAPEYGWDAPYALTAEGIPYIGPHRNFPHHLFAFGDASHSVTGAYLASRLFLRHFLGEATTADQAFAFTR
jgi:glycine/D-amino acid oxidase-like deaminating enzyme